VIQEHATQTMENVRAVQTVDVVIPCYNYGRYLADCVHSVLSQSGVSVRVLVIDDCSPDNTAEVGQALAAADERVQFRRHAVNQGHIATYNEGIEWTSSDFYLLLSADDYLLPGALARAVRVLTEHPEVGFVYGSAIETDADGPAPPATPAGELSGLVLSGPEFILRSGSHNMVPTPTAVIRVDLQKRVRGYRPELPHSGDLEMWLRLAAHGSVGFVPVCQAVYRRHPRNMSLAYYKKDGGMPDLLQRKAALDCFFETCQAVLPNAAEVRRRQLRALGCDAISWASIALNNGNREISDRLADFALQLSPGIDRSLPWLRLSIKRQIPSAGWRVLRPLVHAIRKTPASFKQLFSRSSGMTRSQPRP
jgi:glycosyltransferase involved in cell wall biosynthesis